MAFLAQFFHFLIDALKGAILKGRTISIGIHSEQGQLRDGEWPVCYFDWHDRHSDRKQENIHHGWRCRISCKCKPSIERRSMNHRSEWFSLFRREDEFLKDDSEFCIRSHPERERERSMFRAISKFVTVHYFSTDSKSTFLLVRANNLAPIVEYHWQTAHIPRLKSRRARQSAILSPLYSYHRDQSWRIDIVEYCNWDRRRTFEHRPASNASYCRVEYGYSEWSSVQSWTCHSCRASLFEWEESEVDGGVAFVAGRVFESFVRKHISRSAKRSK